jgi:lipoprotein-anchoring transpeptidase ErfK/SrfK
MRFAFHRVKTLFAARAFPLLAVMGLSGLLSSCRTGEAPGDEVIRTVLPQRAYWHGDGASGAAKIVINLSEQRLRYYKGGQLVGMSPIASGTPSHPTPRGSFRITEKDLHHRSSCYGDYVDDFGNVVVGDVDCRKDPKPPGSRYQGASMKYFMRVNGPVGMHEGYLPGYPASHGCIRLPTQMAAILYRVTPHGTPVQIVGSASEASGERPIRIGENVLEEAVIEEVRPASAVAGSQGGRNAAVPTAKYRSKPAAKSKKKKGSQQSPVRPGQTQYLPGFS